MKKLLLILLASVFTPQYLMAQDSVQIGEETIESVFYPKFSLIGDYSIGKKFHGFDHNSMRYDMPNAIGSGLSFEAGLYKYFNAGASINFRIPLKIRDGEPILLRLLVFGKPYFSIGSRFAFFSRIGAGIVSSIFSNEMNYLDISDDERSKISSLYSGYSINSEPFGLSGLATLGVEYFFLSRYGISLEWGIRADMNWQFEKLSYMRTPYEADTKFGPLSKKTYLTYDFPFALNLIFIL